MSQWLWKPRVRRTITSLFYLMVAVVAVTIFIAYVNLIGFAFGAPFCQ